MTIKYLISGKNLEVGYNVKVTFIDVDREQTFCFYVENMELANMTIAEFKKIEQFLNK